MKRHISLTPLSREHHGGLILARLLQKGAPAYKGMPTDPIEKAAYAIQFYQDELIDHFTKEESVLLPVIKNVNSILDEMSDTIIHEHSQLRSLFENISKASHLENYLDVLGKTLEMHIRKEEREFFPLIQASCSESKLAEISHLLDI
jgi:iron-sulfur cluster repair protein YtfE (RIC family)